MIRNYRAWVKEEKRYAKVLAINFNSKEVVLNEINFVNSLGNKGPSHTILSFDDVVLEQETGLKDKKGKEIYEGDVVEEYGDYMKVYFEDGAFMVGDEKGFMFLNDCHATIVGNINENPELLKSEEQ